VSSGLYASLCATRVVVRVDWSRGVLVSLRISREGARIRCCSRDREKRPCVRGWDYDPAHVQTPVTECNPGEEGVPETTAA
jgi:hypothetical protein